MQKHRVTAMLEKNETMFMNPAGKGNGLPGKWGPWGSGDVGSDPVSCGCWPPLADSFTHTFALKKPSTGLETRRAQKCCLPLGKGVGGKLQTV